MTHKEWNAMIDMIIRNLENKVYHEAQDTDWYLGYNYAKKQSIDEVLKLRK